MPGPKQLPFRHSACDHDNCASRYCPHCGHPVLDGSGPRSLLHYLQHNRDVGYSGDKTRKRWSAWAQWVSDTLSSQADQGLFTPAEQLKLAHLAARLCSMSRFCASQSVNGTLSKHHEKLVLAHIDALGLQAERLLSIVCDAKTRGELLRLRDQQIGPAEKQS